MLVKAVPYWAIAALIAAISLSTITCPAEHQIPSRSVDPELMAAGIAEIGELAVPAC